MDNVLNSSAEFHYIFCNGSIQAMSFLFHSLIL